MEASLIISLVGVGSTVVALVVGYGWGRHDGKQSAEAESKPKLQAAIASRDMWRQKFTAQTSELEEFRRLKKTAGYLGQGVGSGLKYMRSLVH